MSHSVQDEASLEMGRRVAARLRENPELLQIARANLANWSRRNADTPSLLRCYQEWQALLELPLLRVCELLTAETEEGQRLRQSSPFAGVLSPKEVWAIKTAVRQRHAAQTLKEH